MAEDIIRGSDLYKRKLYARNADISMMGARNKHFIILNIAFGCLFFIDLFALAILSALLGAILSFIWVCGNRGRLSKISELDYQLSEIEKEIAPNIHFFNVDQGTVRKTVEQKIFNEENKEMSSKWLGRKMLKIQSANFIEILLPLQFIIGWIVLIALRIMDYYRNYS